jgi:hypothetical protein
MAGYNPITIAIDSGDMYTNSQLLGVISITGGDNVSLDNSGGIINVVQDPCFNSLTINNDVSGNTANFNTVSSTDYIMTGTQSTGVNSLTRKDYVDSKLTTKQNTITSSTDVVAKSLQITTSLNSGIVTSDNYFQSGTQGTSTNSLTRKDYVDSLIGVSAITGGDNISVDSSDNIINVTQDPSFTSLTVNGDISGNTSSFNTVTSDDYLMTGTQSTEVNSLTRKDYVDTQVATKQDTLTTSTDIIGQSLNIAINQNERCILGKANVGDIGFTDFAGFCHHDMNDGSGTYALLQNSTGNTYLNAATGKGVYLRIANQDAITIDQNKDVVIKEDLKVDGTLDHKANIYFRTCDGSPPAPTGTLYYPEYNRLEFNGNTNIYGTWTTPSSSASTGLQVLKTGYYRVEAKMNWKDISYANRYQVWARILINNVDIPYSADFCYGRLDAYIAYTTTNINYVASLTANDWIKFDCSLTKNSTTFGASWDTGGTIDRYGFDCFTITYLGV